MSSHGFLDARTFECAKTKKNYVPEVNCVLRTLSHVTNTVLFGAFGVRTFFPRSICTHADREHILNLIVESKMRQKMFEVIARKADDVSANELCIENENFKFSSRSTVYFIDDGCSLYVSHPFLLILKRAFSSVSLLLTMREKYADFKFTFHCEQKSTFQIFRAAVIVQRTNLFERQPDQFAFNTIQLSATSKLTSNE